MRQGILVALALAATNSPVLAEDSPRAERLDARGDHAYPRLDRKGNRIDRRLDRRGDVIDARLDQLDRRAARVNH